VFFTLPSEPLQYLGDGVEPAANLSRRVELVGDTRHPPAEQAEEIAVYLGKIQWKKNIR
jgi:hypothetical protein